MQDNQPIQIQKQRDSLIPNPNRPPRKPRVRNNNDPLSRQEIELLLSKIVDLTDYTLLLFGFSSGVRVGELAFDYTAINWDEGFINVWDEKKDRYRHVYVPDPIFAALKRYWQERGDRKSPKFFNIGSKTIERKIQKWTKEVLGKTKSWHCARHTYITLSFEAHIPISVVIENTGDKPSTILQYYTKLSPIFIKAEINEKAIFKVV